jgi:hypothetical protein
MSSNPRQIWYLDPTPNGWERHRFSPFAAHSSERVGEYNGQFHPEGNWVAYESDDGNPGNSEIYVASFKGSSGNPSSPVKIASGRYPRWSRDGKSVYYVKPDGTLWQAKLKIRSGRVSRTDVSELLHGPLPTDYGYQYDVSSAAGTVIVAILPGQDNNAPFEAEHEWFLLQDWDRKQSKHSWLLGLRDFLKLNEIVTGFGKDGK